MDCSQNFPLTNREFMQGFNKKISRHRVPLSGNIALTNSCNLRCIHCYLGSQKKCNKYLNPELNADQWKNVIDEITEAGCLFLLITGGEPLLRKDFPAIYSHAKKNGLLVTVFSNGTLVNDTILELFADLPPKAIEITLYGATEQTYERITGISGSYRKCIQGINCLKENNINLRLKTVLLKHNQKEFYAMENLAKKLDLKFRFDASVFPTLEGNKNPMELRVNAKDAIEMEFSDPDRSQQWEEFYLRLCEVPVSDSLYRCGAGHSLFYINPAGYLQPCLMVPYLNYNLLEGDFLTGWNVVMPRLRAKKIDAHHICKQCDKKTLCGYCPGFFNLETGSEKINSQYLCDQGQFRYDKIKKSINKSTEALKGESIGIETR